jgi:hypothetical protein
MVLKVIGTRSNEQNELLAQDAVIRERGALMAAVEPTVTTVRA